MGRKKYVVQKNGQVTLPAELRREYGLRKGDAVVFRRKDSGWVIEKETPDPLALLEQLGVALREEGIELDEWLASGREIREAMLKEKYNFDADAEE